VVRGGASILSKAIDDNDLYHFLSGRNIIYALHKYTYHVYFTLTNRVRTPAGHKFDSPPRFSYNQPIAISRNLIVSRANLSYAQLKTQV